MSFLPSKTPGWLGLLAVTATLLATSAAEARTVGLVLSKADAFITTLKQGVEAHAASLGDVTIKAEDAGGDPARQMDILKKMVASGVESIVIIAVDGDQGVALSKVASDAGVPLVFLNNQPIHVEEMPARQAYVGSDEMESGTLQTKEVCRLLKGKGRVAVMMGELLHFAARTRTTDIERVLAGPDCAGIEVVERQSANWSRAQAEGLVGEWVSGHVAFDAIIANNDEMALGAIDGLKRNGAWTGKTIVAGVDATKDALASMQAGDLKITILQSAKKQSAAALDAALALAAGQSVEPKIFVPFELVTPDNLASYVAAK